MAVSKWVPESDPVVLRRVGKTGEECAELAKICSRIVIQGLSGVDPESGVPNVEALKQEVADVMAQCEVTIRALNLSREVIHARVDAKIESMNEWENLYTSSPSFGLFEPKLGELVRYNDGSTALVLHGEPHAGGWHGQQATGGSVFYTKLYRPTYADRIRWVECAVKWRKTGLAQALAEAGLPPILFESEQP